MSGGPELYGFPPPARLPDLRWLGPDYVSVLVYDLTQGLLRQDPGTRVMGVRCEGEPELRPTVDPSGVIRAHDATFPLQVFVQDGAGRPWRLRGRWTYSGRDLGTAAASITHFWQLVAAEGV
ncbi:hypothetical protein [Spirillospora sp. NPDC029432]|uniref:hypothetical protein n=1 Tax=Spirillospora sp. NPDC029432 TaxID=3154599 RepID=UPI003455E480